MQADGYGEGDETMRNRADALARWENRSENAARISAMLHLAESDPRLLVSVREFDRDPWLLNLRNGTLELRSGHFREHRPQELLTRMAGAEYQSNARCPSWEKFLGQVFAPHPEVSPFLQKAIGYTLTGDVREECVFVLLGLGRNGKSTLLRVLDCLLGDYAGVAEFDAFLACRGSYLREDIADMRGRRLVSAQEPDQTGVFAEAMLKWISGGDKLRARRLYEHAQEFHPSHKLWLAANRLPTISKDDRAAWGRLRVIPFDVSFERNPDRGLKDKLLTELDGILQWALRGCLQWEKHGLDPPSAVMASQVGRVLRGTG